jgi:hypothetical protein
MENPKFFIEVLDELELFIDNKLIKHRSIETDKARPTFKL